MKYLVTVGERQLTLDLEESGGGKRVTTGGPPVPLDIREFADSDRFSILVEARSHTVTVRPQGLPGASTYVVAVGGRTFDVVVEDGHARVLKKIGGAHEEVGELVVKAPMPGLVLKVQVQPGQHVVKNDHLLVLEAMKMENDISTPRGGAVKEIRVRAGQKVNLGDVLMVIA
jgi:acetyl/propionyl-CoA carboxylase alpha subunit